MTGYTFSQLFDFTRTTAGTFVGSNGLIQNTPASVNLLTFTQEFDNAAWTKNGLNAFGSGSSANSAAAPDGTLTADFLQENSLASNHGVSVSYTYDGTPHTLSCYFKASGRSRVELSLDAAGTQAYATFDLVGSGSVPNVGIGAVATITSVGNGWYRCAVTFAPTAGAKTVRTRSGNAANDYFYTGDGTSGLLIWGAQLEANATATTYTRNNGGVFPARFDYDPATLAPKGILIEEQRTNLLTYSQELNSAPWLSGVGYNSTIPANTALAPDGTVTADTLLADNAGGTGSVILARGLSAISGTTYTFSFFAKRNTLSWISLYLLNFTTPANGGAFFDLASGSIGTVDAGRTATITNFGNGWYRCAITFTAGATVSTELRVYLASANNSTTVNRNGTDSVFLWGAQLEVGAFPTSYIPTVASQVTRSADLCNITAPMFAPWYNQSTGTFVADFVPYVVSGGAGGVFSANSGGTSNRIDLRRDGFSLIDVAGVRQAELSVAGMTANVSNRLSVAYEVNNFALVRNGGAPSTDTSGTVPTVNLLQIGGLDNSPSLALNGHIRRITYYPFRASNNQLQALTT